ncbi:hypothetical protein [Paenibacillus sp. GYB003]|uniref:hypothetical protein n=1 Tax=Paenibacillus sp. GYB003 TaxID=2994392 RepID=UPI002F9643FD
MKIVRITVVSLLLLWFAVLVVHAAQIALKRKAAEMRTTSFLMAMQAQRFDLASERYAGEIDTERLERLHDDGFRLVSYSAVKAEYDDGCVCGGHADLTFEANGKPLHATAVFTVGSGYRPKQVCVLTPSGSERGPIPELSEWNMLVCGGDSF